MVQLIVRPIETIFTVFVGSVICCIYITIIILGAVDTSDRGLPRGLALLFSVPFVLLNVPYMIALWRWRIPKSCSRAEYVAASQPLWPVVLRPLIFVWWLAHFGFAALLAFAVDRASFMPTHDALPHRMLRSIIAFMIAAGLCATANHFLLVAIAALTRREVVVKTFWRSRYLIDLAVAAAVCIIPIKG